LISQRLSGDGGITNIITGLIGGDINAMHDMEHILYKQVRLKDIWEDALLAHPSSLERGKVDPYYGRISGHS
jgi:hypothetical protein